LTRIFFTKGTYVKHFLRFFLLIFLICLANNYIGCEKSDSSKASGNITFEKVFSQIPGYGRFVEQTAEDGYIILTSTGHLIKTDGNGTVTWNKMPNNEDQFFSVKEIQDGYVATAGTYDTATHGVSSEHLSKLNSDGDTLWSKKFSCSCIYPTNDGGYIAGFGAELIKLKANGDTAWSKNYSVPNGLSIIAVQQTKDGGYAAAGQGNDDESRLMKTDSIGNKLWYQSYLIQGGSDVNSLEQTADGGYIVCGSTYHGAASMFIANSTGDTLWTRAFKQDNWYALGSNASQTTDGGYVVMGSSHTIPQSHSYVYLIKTDVSGDTLWTRTYGDSTKSNEGGWIQQTQDHGFIMVGGTGTGPLQTDAFNLYLIKTDENGIVVN
jgi:hypothetical protein